MQPKGRPRMREAGDARRGFSLPKAVVLKVCGKDTRGNLTACK